MLTWFVHYWLLPRSKHPLVSKVRRGGRRGGEMLETVANWAVRSVSYYLTEDVTE